MFIPAINSMLDTVFGSELIQTAVKAITATSSLNVGEIVQIASNACMPIATVLLAIYFVMAVMDQLTSGNFTSDHFIKLLIKLAFGEFMIANSTYFVLLFTNVGISFMTKINSAFSEQRFNVKFNDELGMGEQLAWLVILLIPFVVVQILKIALWALGAARSLEIAVRAMIAPIGLADIMNGTHSNAFRFLKKCLGLALQGGLMMIVLSAANSLIMATIMSEDANALNMVLQYIGINGAMILMLATTKSLATEMVGA